MRKSQLGLIAALLLCLLSSWAAPKAAYGRDDGAELLFSNYSETIISLRGYSIACSGLSPGQAYLRLRKVEAQEGQSMPRYTTIHNTSKSQVQQGLYSYTYSPAQISPGVYELSCFHNPESKNSSLTLKAQVYVEIGQQGFAFVPTPSLGIYESFRQESPSDDEYLKYCLQPSSTVQSGHPYIRERARRIIDGLEDDYAKAKAIHDWVSGNIYYDEELLQFSYNYYETRSALYTLVQGKSTCGGYANLTAALLRAAGIPARLICGTPLYFSPQEKGYLDHVWTEAFVSGSWIIIDSTFDSANSYRNGQYYPAEPGQSTAGEAYFDPTLQAYAYQARFEYVWEAYLSRDLLSRPLLSLVSLPRAKLHMEGNIIALSGLPSGRAKIAIYKAPTQAGETYQLVFDIGTMVVEGGNLKYQFFDSSRFEPDIKYVLLAYHSPSTQAVFDSNAPGGADWQHPQVRLQEILQVDICLSEQGWILWPEP